MSTSVEPERAKSERLAVRVTPAVRRLIEQAAAKENRNLSNWIESAALEALRRQGISSTPD